jgi:hypothetical protein
MNVVIPWREAIRDSDLDRTAKLVAYTLSTYMNGGGAAFPSKTLLARGASLGNPNHKGSSALDAAVNRLEAAGFVAITRRRGRKGFSYQAVIPRGDAGISDDKSRADDDVNPASSASEIPRGGAGEVVEVEVLEVEEQEPALSKDWVQELTEGRAA